MTITQIQYINVQEMLVVIFEFTGAARGVKKVGQHWSRPSSATSTRSQKKGKVLGRYPILIVVGPIEKTLNSFHIRGQCGSSILQAFYCSSSSEFM